MRFGVGRVTPFGATTSCSLKSELAKGRLGDGDLRAVVAAVDGYRVTVTILQKHPGRPGTPKQIDAWYYLPANWLNNNLLSEDFVGYVHFSQNCHRNLCAELWVVIWNLTIRALLGILWNFGKLFFYLCLCSRGSSKDSSSPPAILNSYPIRGK